MTGRVEAPDGRRWLRLATEADAATGHEFARLEIGAGGGEVDYRSRIRWPTWFALNAAWDESGRAWVASADTGVSVFERADGEWRRYAWESSASAADRPPLRDIATGETIEWLDADPPAELRGAVRGA